MNPALKQQSESMEIDAHICHGIEAVLKLLETGASGINSVEAQKVR